MLLTSLPLAHALEERYLLERELGRGGMAVVYLAQDRRHERQVAVKVLEPHYSELLGADRFLREIKVAARLHHPHLLPLYDSGEVEGVLFYVVPYIEGGSLRDRIRDQGRLPLAPALRLIREAAEGLDYAHRNGVVHRDIKPENILLEDEHAIVADFGIARAIDAAADGPLTETGLLVGTPVYMSPEQASGEPVDGRSDIYSLGCVLYELLAAVPPFRGNTPLAVLAQRFTDRTPSLQAAGVAVSPEVEDAVTRALARHPADRYASAAEFAEVLGEVAAGISRPYPTSTPPRHTVRCAALAVLPFVNLTPDADNEYFSDGLTEELINALAKVGNLRVASRTSAFTCRGKGLDISEIGQKLNVNAVLEGSVRRAGGRLRLTAQLINVVDGYQLWSETYERELADIFALQDELSRAIVDALKVRLAGEAPLIVPPTANLDAYQLYLKGRFFWNKRTPDGLRKGIEYFEQAIGADPNYALAYSGLADSYHMLSVYGVLPTRDAYLKAKPAAERALQLNDRLAETHVSNAYVALCSDWDFAGAERALRKAIELNPSYAQAHHWLGWCLIVRGRLDEAASSVRRAIELEPLSPVVHARGGHILTYAGLYQEGVAACQQALELDPTLAVAYESLAVGYLRQGRWNEARALLEQATQLPGTTAPLLLAWANAAAGDLPEAQRRLDALGINRERTRVPLGYTALFVAWTYAAMGDNDEAFRWIEQAYEDRVFAVLLLKVEQGFEQLQSDPRYAELIQRIGLE